MSNEVKKTAAQRIEDLEKGVYSLYQTADNMARDLMITKDALKLLGNKVQSVVQVLAAGTAMTEEAVGKQMVANNVDELKEKVTNLVNQGVLVGSEEATDTSFIVGQEVDDEGTVVNPRLQFALNGLNEELRNKFKGAKVGDLLTLQEGKLKFQVQELYTIQAPPPPPAPASAPTEASASAPDSSAATDTPAPTEAAQSSENDASAQSAPAQPSSGN